MGLGADFLFFKLWTLPKIIIPQNIIIINNNNNNFEITLILFSLILKLSYN